MINSTSAAIISFILPGIGQIIQGETKIGLKLFAIFIILNLIIFYAHLGFGGTIISFIYSSFAAYNAYPRGA